MRACNRSTLTRPQSENRVDAYKDASISSRIWQQVDNALSLRRKWQKHRLLEQSSLSNAEKNGQVVER